MPADRVILVDLTDREIGSSEKMAAHEKGLLHRAFSVFLFNGSKLLLQKRAADKYHCPGLWTNTCCSHPRPGEETAKAAQRRLAEELGTEPCEITELCSFFYRYEFSNGLTEYECDHVFLGEYSPEAKLCPNPDEVEEAAWWDICELEEELRLNPDRFTPWFIICAPMVINAIRQNICNE